MNKVESTAYQNVWNIMEAMLTGKFRALNTYIKKEEKFQINSLTFYHKILEKEQIKPKQAV